MGFFKKKKPQETHWLEQVESFANFYGDLKLDIESMVNEALVGNFDVAEQFWEERWGEHERSCAFFYVLGALEAMYKEIAEFNDESDY